MTPDTGLGQQAQRPGAERSDGSGTASAISASSVLNSTALVEVGWLILGPLDELDRRAVATARKNLTAQLNAKLPGFQWRMPAIEHEGGNALAPVEPTELLEMGVDQRNARSWDYTVIVTGADLVSHYQTEAVACISRSLEGVVISTRRLDPRSESIDAEEDVRVNALVKRLQTLVSHALGHHGGLSHSADPENFMAELNDMAAIDRARQFDAQQFEGLHQEFADVADNRLEETTTYRHSGAILFYLRSGWLNRREVFDAIVQARPWQFPYRLSRLTTAAISAALVLFLTAEAWELALHQSAVLLGSMAATTIAVTTFYVLRRQRLFLRRRQAPLSEQTVTTNLATLAIVLSGIATTFLALLTVVCVLGWLLFSGQLAASWAGAAPAAGYAVPIKPAVLATSLAMFIGALGASFENTAYFRHVTFVDEEI